jgi:hypothetical protein
MRPERPSYARRPRKRIDNTTTTPAFPPPIATIDAAPTREAALSQQREAADTRARAQQMLTADREMHVRLQRLQVRIAASDNHSHRTGKQPPH